MKLKVFIIIIFITILSQSVTVDSSDLTTSCKGCVLYEANSGRVLYDKNMHKQMYIASITKIMTAIVAIEEGYLDDEVVISKEASLQIGSSIYLEAGDRVKLIDLIYGLMLRSGNDAAYAIAEHVGKDVDHFVYLMNEKAKELGMYNSVFSNPSGLDETTKNLSTAYDMALLMGYAMGNPIYMKINGTTVHKSKTHFGKYLVFINKHKLINNYDFITGGKTGYTKLAKRTLVTSAQKDGMDLVVVTLNDSNDWEDHLKLFEYGFEKYRMRKIFDRGLFYVQDLDKLFYIDKDIEYPMNDHEIEDYEFIIDTLIDSPYLILMKDDQVILKEPIDHYNYLNDQVEVNQELSIKDRIKVMASDILW